MAGWNQRSMKRGLIKPTIEVVVVPAQVVPVAPLKAAEPPPDVQELQSEIDELKTEIEQVPGTAAKESK